MSTEETTTTVSTPAPPKPKKDMTKVHEARRKKAAAKRESKKQLDEVFQKQQEKQDNDSSSESEDDKVFVYEAPSDYKKKKELKEQRFNELFEKVVKLEHLAQKNKKTKTAQPPPPHADSEYIKETINKTPCIHPLNVLYGLR